MAGNRMVVAEGCLGRIIGLVEVTATVLCEQFHSFLFVVHVVRKCTLALLSLFLTQLGNQGRFMTY